MNWWIFDQDVSDDTVKDGCSLFKIDFVQVLFSAMPCLIWCCLPCKTSQWSPQTGKTFADASWRTSASSRRTGGSGSSCRWRLHSPCTRLFYRSWTPPYQIWSLWKYITIPLVLKLFSCCWLALHHPTVLHHALSLSLIHPTNTVSIKMSHDRAQSDTGSQVYISTVFCAAQHSVRCAVLNPYKLWSLRKVACYTAHWVQVHPHLF